MDAQFTSLSRVIEKLNDVKSFVHLLAMDIPQEEAVNLDEIRHAKFLLLGKIDFDIGLVVQCLNEVEQFVADNCTQQDYDNAMNCGVDYGSFKKH